MNDYHLLNSIPVKRNTRKTETSKITGKYSVEDFKHFAFN